ncbi:hypothetical protein [Actinomadura yumaensis]|uniref:Uncharacterized protein n=2 Tax=Thermomonosporaceae TaxID=2012 RepID=A0ABW2CLT7_9ACTN
MAEETPPAKDRQENAMSGTRIDPGGETGRTHRRAPLRRPRPPAAAQARARAVSLLAGVISVITTIVVLVLAAHIVFVAFEANTSNDLVTWIGDRATDLAWQFKDVFQPDDRKVEVAVNYGLAAVVYLAIGRVLVALVRRLA